MKTKGILKFKTELSKGGMHYITYKDMKVSLTLSNSRKVFFIKDKGYLNIAQNLLSRTFTKVKVSLHTDPILIKEVFEFMNTSKHTHYKDWNNDFIVIEYNE